MNNKVKSGFAFHIHHDILFDYCYDFDARIAHIKANKPPEEQELRLRLFQIIPSNRIPENLVNVLEAYETTWEAAFPLLTELHKELCPNCPWDGKTIFPEK